MNKIEKSIGVSSTYSSSYRGVSWNKEKGRWQSSIKKNRKRYFVGYFDDEVGAAKAYDAKALEVFGKFARPNFPERGSEHSDKTSSVCRRCGERKRLNKFPPNSMSRLMLPSWCKQCKALQSAQYYANNREDILRKGAIRRRFSPVLRADIRKYNIKHRYGVSPEYIDKLVSESDKCAICARPWGGGMRGPAVDHDHETGRIRGILCKRCNAAIGALGDSIQGLRIAIEYLKRSEINT